MDLLCLLRKNIDPKSWKGNILKLHFLGFAITYNVLDYFKAKVRKLSTLSLWGLSLSFSPILGPSQKGKKNQGSNLWVLEYCVVSCMKQFPRKELLYNYIRTADQVLIKFHS